MSTQILTHSKSAALICSSSEFTFSKCTQTYKHRRIYSKTEKVIDAILKKDQSKLKLSFNQLMLC